jgi:tetratricopeptide (TPR) repeat protein
MNKASRLFIHVFTFAIVLCVSRSVRAEAPADDPRELLARAQALYYEADFAKSVELLLQADELLSQQTGRLQEKTDVKLQLALGYIGLNDGNLAKTYLVHLYSLDPDFRVDPEMFSPKVLRIAEDAKAEQNELRCRILSDEAQQRLDSGNSEDALKVIDSGRARCAGLTALYPKAGELLFKDGMAAYRKSDLEDALQKFRTAQRLNPENVLAVEYVELIVSKLELAADRAFVTWRKDYDARDFSSATRAYQDLMARASADRINEVRTEYRRALSGLVDSWNNACAKDDALAMEEIRMQINELLPETLFAEDILSKIKTCSPAGCIQMPTTLALARLKTRVDPEFPPFIASQIRNSMTVRVKATINEKGAVKASDVRGDLAQVNTLVREAVEKWKFFPALIQGEARCVDTEIPIVINRN